MTTPRPSFLPVTPDVGMVKVDWAALPDGWEGRSPNARYRDETRGDYANRVRAQVVEGLAGVEYLRFADRLPPAA